MADVAHYSNVVVTESTTAVLTGFGPGSVIIFNPGPNLLTLVFDGNNGTAKELHAESSIEQGGIGTVEARTAIPGTRQRVFAVWYAGTVKDGSPRP